MPGNATKSATVSTSQTKNHQMPLKIELSGMSGLTPATTKQFSPIGGVISQISTIFTTMMPNQIGSNPSAMISGCTSGKVSSSMPMASMNMPSTP